MFSSLGLYIKNVYKKRSILTYANILVVLKKFWYTVITYFY